MAQVALLPPFEGFDETAHYSYIQQMAETATWPRYGDPKSAEVEDYFKLTAPAGSAPWTYKAFFDAPAEAIAAKRAVTRSVRDPNRPWQAGKSANWEAQHPPLYYLIMAAAYVPTKGWSLVDQLFLQRGLSYFLAWLALCLTALSFLHDRSVLRAIWPAPFIAPAAWPYFFPEWFPEMARLGNDSLVALLVACAFVVSKRLFVSEGNLFRHGMLGFICGLGLLTKATFLPVAVTLAVLLAFRIWQARSVRRSHYPDCTDCSYSS